MYKKIVDFNFNRLSLISTCVVYVTLVIEIKRKNQKKFTKSVKKKKYCIHKKKKNRHSNNF